MQKMVALVALRLAPHSGSAFRRWFAKRVSDMYWHTLFERTREWREGFQPSVAHYAKMTNIEIAISTNVARYNHRQNYRLCQMLKSNAWFNFWGWHDLAHSK